MNAPHHPDLDQALDEWHALVGREDAYRLPPSSQEEGGATNDGDHPHHPCPPAWREKICEWCYQVIDHCDIDRGIVSVALSYFDRFLACRPSSGDDDASFQLVAMTSLFLAAKLHSTRKISASSMASLSKGCFSVDQILATEVCILQTLRWHLNPPTPSMYLDILSPVLDAVVVDSQISYEVAELARYLLELGACDSYFVNRRPSCVAYASILVAMENLPKRIKKGFGSYRLLDGGRSSQVETDMCARRLRHVYMLTTTLDQEDEGEGEPARASMSPTSVLPE